MMIALAPMLATAPAGAGQVLAGPAFEHFARATDRRCPVAQLRSITPGDLDLLQEEFIDQLTERRRTQLVAVNKAGRRCADRNGLACPTTETLAAFYTARLLPAFVTFACDTPITNRRNAAS